MVKKKSEKHSSDLFVIANQPDRNRFSAKILAFITSCSSHKHTHTRAHTHVDETFRDRYG